MMITDLLVYKISNNRMAIMDEVEMGEEWNAYSLLVAKP
jgi:hypothetical protein